MILRENDNSRNRIAAVGMFDGVHLGHRSLVATLTARGNELGLTPTAVTFTNLPRKVVNASDSTELLSSIDEKIAMLTEAGIEDVILLDFDAELRRMSAHDFMAMLARDYSVRAMVIGFNNRFGHDRPADIDTYSAIGKEVGIQVIRADEFQDTKVAHVSSSTIRNLLKHHNVAEARRLLGHPYTLTGTVVHGKEIGRSIGYPTANVEPDAEAHRLIPGRGVYAVTVTLPDGTTHPGMLNIGHRPTVEKNMSPVTIEVHIMDFTGDIYYDRVSINFIEFMRHEQQFASLDALKSQLAADASRARDIVAAAISE